MKNALIESIRLRLEKVFEPDYLEVIDDSSKHQGHEGAKMGGHFKVIISAKAFANKNLLESHKMIYQALADLMKTDIHALSIKIKEKEG